MNARFKSEADFRRALEARLANAARAAGRGLVRERQVCIFERFLARASEADPRLVIKGGMALELRTQRARSTRDIDLRALGDVAQFERSLRELGEADVGDYLRFRVDAHAKPDIEAAGMKYPGRRYRVQANLAGKVYGDPFGVDVAFGEPILGAPERLRGRADLSFIGVEPPELAVQPRATHIAEKLHAYTVPRPTPNSRVRDLPDLALLASVGPIEASTVREAIEQTFAHRATHAMPTSLPAAPERWRAPYGELAASNRLSWGDLDAVHAAARTFVDPILGDAHGHWLPAPWEWAAVERRDE
ncbi:MAG TPA: nucleotidyl transferase AbiEii/AbiGii toxin family protein [Polyangiales bacterium]|nr:nucleotidyl transferase AbiEii/AbiGii toxin family protein [Polyangiales bacterium]